MMLAAAVFIQTPVRARASDGFVSSTPDYDSNTGLSLPEEKEKLRTAVDEFVSLGISPMTIVQKLRHKDTVQNTEGVSSSGTDIAAGTAESSPGAAEASADPAAYPSAADASVGGSSAADASAGGSSGQGGASLTDSVTSMAQDVGSDLVSKAQETGNGIVEGAQQEVQKQKENFLQKLSENIKEALGNFVDGLFSRL